MVVTRASVYMMGSLDSIQGESSKALLEAQSHLWNHTFSFINSMALKCAVELGIPDIIHKHNKPITLSDLSSALSIPQSKTPHLRRLMSLLAHSKFFTEEEEEVFSLTTISEILVKERRTSLSPFVLLMLDPRLLKPWHSLSSWFTRAEPPTAFELAHRTPIWEAFGQAAEFNEMMNEGMSSDAGFTAELVVRDCGEVFRGLSSLVDVGGGTGTLARAIADAFPAIKCTVLDLPRVVERLKESTRVHFVGGDLFDYVPPADATLLKVIES